ncbi:MAG: HAMP domain-containing protein, partial [Acidobacteriota bacterium]|nr:HAMP domain-containing protein [Acidobacteriota bacterium]
MFREPRTRATPRKRITRGLRFRLTAGYALLFTLLLSFLGALVRRNLETSQNAQARDGLEQEWAAVKGYLRIERDQRYWYFDRSDPDEALIVSRLQSVYLRADSNGIVREASPVYRSLGMDSAGFIRKAIQAGSQQPVWREARDPKGTPYLIRGGVVFDEKHEKTYYVAIGRSLEENRAVLRNFTWQCVGLIPLMIFGGSLLGWIFAGRALSPVLEVAQTAQRISGSNLSLRIRSRHAGDELDFLIETFNQMIERLENSFRQIRQFSTDVSHELRTPITIIRGQLEVALFTANTSEQYRDAILESLQDIERLSQIVRALLLLSQAETGQVVLQKEHLDLCALVNDIVDQFQIPAEGAHIEIKALRFG